MMTIDDSINPTTSKVDDDSSRIMTFQQLLPQLTTSHHDALSRFDAAVADNQITYSPSTPILLTDNNFKVHPYLFLKFSLPP